MKFSMDTTLEPGRRYGLSVTAGESVSLIDYGPADSADRVELTFDLDCPEGKIEPVESE